MTTSGQRGAAVEDADIIEPQEAALEDVPAFGVLAVDPPGEVEHELVENALKELAVAFPTPLLIDLIDAPGRPGMYRRVDVAEGPLVRWELAVGVHIPLTQEQDELFLGEVR